MEKDLPTKDLLGEISNPYFVEDDEFYELSIKLSVIQVS